MPQPALNAAIVPVTPLQQNCSLVWCTQTRRGAFIDPGGEIERLLAVAREQNVQIEKFSLRTAISIMPERLHHWRAGWAWKSKARIATTRSGSTPSTNTERAMACRTASLAFRIVGSRTATV